MSLKKKVISGISRQSGRYNTGHLVEDQYEPGSAGKVLKNLLNIKTVKGIERVETAEHLRSLNEFLDFYGINHRFTAKDICHMHKNWLGNVYSWAGEYRSVNISKGTMDFARAMVVPRLMEDFSRAILGKYTPCNFKNKEEIAEAIAVVHTELVLIHPFREGNGRLARMLAVLMALQAGLPILDFGGVKGKKKQEYFDAVRSGIEQNYSPMKKVISEIIKKSLKKFS